MKNFKEYDDQFVKPEIVEKQFSWFAYKNGESKQFDSSDAAKAFSKNTEKVCTNQAEFDASWKAYREVAQQAVDAWYADLREEYSELTDKQFSLCYNEAYDRGHSAGHDEVRSYLYDIVDFAKELLKTVE
jgi:hypothetical protein